MILMYYAYNIHEPYTYTIFICIVKTYKHICLHVCTSMYVIVCDCDIVCVYAFVRICMCVCMCVRVLRREYIFSVCVYE